MKQLLFLLCLIPVFVRGQNNITPYGGKDTIILPALKPVSIEITGKLLGLRIPRLTTTERANVVVSANSIYSSFIWNKTTATLDVWNGLAWVSFLPSQNTTNFGSQQTSGNGSTTTFAFAHGMGGIPSYVNAVPKTSDAGSINYIDADATNIYIHYTIAPPMGVNNLKWYIAVRP